MVLRGDGMGNLKVFSCSSTNVAGFLLLYTTNERTNEGRSSTIQYGTSCEEDEILYFGNLLPLWLPQGFRTNSFL